ncbi:DHA2 family efflux MFS transporter permease subunit [Pseudomonas vancouverensis]|uniref:DHA2 family efflux MFS transporter permease subunit n=1 Tax=Pseudomonas vancouverensis TaxID=95300 RepID=A0A1H2NSI5_PSEVA|nr:DHA2 family efflux MFS transporter permease subunit [Pseudomonas vancouverensis]KAB0491164.1 multidrug efflux MFS transporter [Pseudomonas vancouverensis]TDB59624.1 DHA2 family efflux MFS transporter permease subunit [Pseudomonas vancouverensis]SDV08091.1 MFS transporter, DHA2 family, multidrug resistance protein [Pseudomonas vancouverensis]
MSTPADTGPDCAGSLRFAALLATYMQSANLPLPNAVLRHIQGSLSMSDDQAGWIFTAYLAASAITLPIAQWLAARYGLKRVYQISLAVFALGLLLATVATTPLEFVGARLLQGAASGVLAPLSMAIAMDTLPLQRRVKFGATWTAIVLFGIVSGPGIGGLIAEHFDWRTIFYSSIPLTAYIFLVITLLLERKKPGPAPGFDFFGFATFTLGLIGLQMLLDRGPRLDWFASREICIEALASALGLYLFGVHVLTSKVHFLSKALLRDRNFVLSSLMFFALGFVLLSTMALTSPMLDEILGYPPDTTGALTIPRGVGLVGAFLLMGRVPERFDRRLFVAGGVAWVIYANWLMLGYSPLMDAWPVAVAGAIQGAGLGILMPALSKTAFSTLDPALRVEGTGLFNLARVYGSTLGVAIVQWWFFNNTQAMHTALAGNLTAYREASRSLTSAPTQVLAGLNEMITGQAAFIGVIGQFKILLMVMLVVSPLVLFLRKPVATN